MPKRDLDGDFSVQPFQKRYQQMGNKKETLSVPMIKKLVNPPEKLGEEISYNHKTNKTSYLP